VAQKKDRDLRGNNLQIVILFVVPKKFGNRTSQKWRLGAIFD
jgi:hypothetical protein